jgi:hypothetical protein
MRCEACDRLLNDSEATAKFAESGTYVGLCRKDRGFLPKSIKIILRPDLDQYESVSDYDMDADAMDNREEDDD